MSDQRRRRWADVVQMLYNCFFVCWDTPLCEAKRQYVFTSKVNRYCPLAFHGSDDGHATVPNK